jgi:hypothetical protein
VTAAPSAHAPSGESAARSGAVTAPKPLRVSEVP